MDRQRFEAAHLKYACLRVVAQYPEAISLKSVKFKSDVSVTLYEITPALFSCFEARYAGTSVCTYICKIRYNDIQYISYAIKLVWIKLLCFNNTLFSYIVKTFAFSQFCIIGIVSGFIRAKLNHELYKITL